MNATKIIGLDAFVNAIDGMSKGLDRIPGIIGRRIINEAIPDYFDAEESPDGKKWDDLNLIYSQKKEKKYGSGKLKLEGSGNLKRAIGYKTEGLKVLLGAGDGDVPYANIHNEGGYAGKNKSVYIPKREYLGVGEKEERIIDETVKNYVLSMFK